MKTLLASVATIVISLFSMQAVAEKKLQPETLEGTTRISAEQVFELVEEHDDLVIIDSRKTSDRQEGYIETSIGLQDTDTTAESLAKHLASKTTPVIFYCNGPKCGRSANASRVAIADGYSKIYWFRGGWEEWVAKGLPVTK